MTDGCGFLAGREVEALLEGTLPERRRAELEDHAAQGCGRCALLIEDARLFGASLEGEVSASDRDAGDRDRDAIRRSVQSHRFRTRRRRNSWRMGLGVAATVMFACLVWLGQRGAAIRPDTFNVDLGSGRSVEVSFLAFSPPDSVRGEPSLAELWSEAGRLYDAGRFEKAAAAFELLASKDAKSADPPLYAGIAWLAAGDAEKARSAFDEAVERGVREDLPEDMARWYRALAAAAAGQVGDALLDLETVAAEPGPFAARAAALKRELAASPLEGEGKR